MSNTHTQIAQLRAAGVHEWQAEERSTDATNIAAGIDAQTEATLALTYEQRTANLIALWTDPKQHGDEMSGINYGTLADQIKGRLGL